MTDWRDVVEEERQDRESAEDDRQDAIAEYADRIKARCRQDIIGSPELWRRWVQDYGTVLLDEEYSMLEGAARLAFVRAESATAATVRRAWTRALDLGAEDMALAEAEREFAQDVD